MTSKSAQITVLNFKFKTNKYIQATTCFPDVSTWLFHSLQTSNALYPQTDQLRNDYSENRVDTLHMNNLLWHRTIGRFYYLSVDVGLILWFTTWGACFLGWIIFYILAIPAFSFFLLVLENGRLFLGTDSCGSWRVWEEDHRSCMCCVSLLQR